MVPTWEVRAAPDRLLTLVRSVGSMALVAVVICALGWRAPCTSPAHERTG
ncbi:MAG: hypothetical protein ACOH2F_19830 [Cellulomonas sp.]